MESYREIRTEIKLAVDLEIGLEGKNEVSISSREIQRIITAKGKFLQDS